MTGPTFSIDELYTLSDIACDGALTKQDFVQLEQLLRGNVNAQQYYLKHVCLDRWMRWEFARQVQEPLPPCSPSPVFGILSTAYHGTIGFFSQELPFSLLIATVLTSLGLWFASLIYVSSPEEIAKDSSLPVQSSFDPTLKIVGKITGMVDCKWADPTTAPVGDNVALGRRFALASGLMEITYDTGAKVILQGPVTYEVESTNGGFLPIGKLTGKVENEVARGFSVRTPTAIVTDLGTEFGIEVDRSGVTESHVFRGAIKVQVESAPGSDQNESRTVDLKENESIRVEKASAADNSPRIVVVRKAANSERFVRTLPPPEKPSLVDVLAYFRMGEDDPGATASQPAGEKTINHGRRWYLKKYGSPTYTANAAPGSTLAMNFSGAEGECFYTRYLCWPPNDDFILEAWVRLDRGTNRPTFVLYNGSGYDGYGLGLNGREWWLLGPIGVPTCESGSLCELGKWTHVALVCERGKLQLWVNGRLAREFGNTSAPVSPNGSFAIGGAPKNLDPSHYFSFDGQIDEVRLSRFQGTFNPKMLLFHESSERGK